MALEILAEAAAPAANAASSKKRRAAPHGPAKEACGQAAGNEARPAAKQGRSGHPPPLLGAQPAPPQGVPAYAIGAPLPANDPHAHARLADWREQQQGAVAPSDPVARWHAAGGGAYCSAVQHIPPPQGLHYYGQPQYGASAVDARGWPGDGCQYAGCVPVQYSSAVRSARPPFGMCYAHLSSGAAEASETMMRQRQERQWAGAREQQQQQQEEPNWGAPAQPGRRFPTAVPVSPLDPPPAALEGDGNVPSCALLGGGRGCALASNTARKIKTTKMPKSPYVGVSSRQDGKYKSVVVFQGQSIFIGAFSSETDAALHYDSVAAPLGKRVNDGMRARAILEQWPHEARSIAQAVHAIDHASVRLLARNLATLYSRCYTLAALSQQ